MTAQPGPPTTVVAAAGEHTEPDELLMLLRTVVTLMLEARDQTPQERPSIHLLEQAGFNYKQIAALTGRTPDGVRMALARAKASPQKKATAKRAKKITATTTEGS